MSELNLVEAHASGGHAGYGSEFDYDSEGDRRRARRKDLAAPQAVSKSQLPSKREVVQEYDKDEGIRQRYHVLSLDAYSRHKKYMNDYLLYFGGSTKDFERDTSRDKRDIDVIRENHRFLWEDDDQPEETWEKRLAKKYHDKLFKEYCIVDLSRYRENKVALRWRIEKEVVDGKGQFVCGNKKCNEGEVLRSWEVNFGYMEHDTKKNALVKLRLCPECSHKLNYHHKKKEVVKKRKSSGKSVNSSKRQKHSDTELESEEKAKAGDEGEGCKAEQQEVATEKPADTSEASGEGDDDNLWSKPAPVVEDKSREDEFEDYFEDMFL